MQGKKVKVVDILPEDALCQDVSIFARIALLMLMKDYGIERVQGSVSSITSSGVVVALPDGAVMELPADTAVIAFGLRVDLASAEPLLEVIPESYLVGDCSNVGMIYSANHDAFDVAVEV